MTIDLDRVSLLVRVAGSTTLAALEAELRPQGLTLGFALADHGDTTVAAWLEGGARGAPSLFSDPADHLVAGLEGTLANGKRIAIHPSPRRAVGPDLLALFVGAGGRFGRIESVWLRVHDPAAKRVSLPLPAGLDLDPPLTDDEARLGDAIASALGSASR